MNIDELYQPHVSIIHRGAKHFYSVMMICPRGCSLMYRKIGGGEPHTGTTSKYQIEFSFNVHRSGQWFNVPGLNRTPLTINGKDCEFLQFERPIKSSDLNRTSAEFVTRITGHPHIHQHESLKSKKEEESIVIHDDTVHLPGGN